MTAAEDLDHERALRDPHGAFAASEGESMGGGEDAMLQRVCDARAELARPGPSAASRGRRASEVEVAVSTTTPSRPVNNPN